jgi:neutral trehalase
MDEHDAADRGLVRRIAEYGNVGTKFSYIAPEGFGWMNASFQVGTNYLSSARLAD